MEIALKPTSCWGPPKRDRGPRFPPLSSLLFSSFCHFEKLSLGAGTCDREGIEAAGVEGEHWGGLNLLKTAHYGKGEVRKKEEGGRERKKWCRKRLMPSKGSQAEIKKRLQGTLEGYFAQFLSTQLVKSVTSEGQERWITKRTNKQAW